MEAMSAGIPIFATDVGGTSEIVDDSVGKLLAKNITAPELARTITAFYKLDPERKMECRKNAKNRYLGKCDAVSLAQEITTFLHS